jgi:hypothetical protein
MKEFKEFTHHEEVKCFSCQRKLIKMESIKSGYPTGKYAKYCPDCDMHTFYDFETEGKP